jgi:hypothetical protein
MNNIGFFLYLIFTASWFLHLTARIPFLGLIRADLILVLALFLIHLMSGENGDYIKEKSYKKLILLIFVIILTTPFTEWPGSVFRFGLPNFIKAVVFFFFSIWYLTNNQRLKTFVFVYILCQSFRVIEPLFLHVTQGYWGDKASMANWENMNRLAGSPFDVVNSNGLAFIVLTIIPFFIVFYHENIFCKIIGLTVGPASLYVLYLTASRSGMLGFIFILFVFLLNSKRKLPILILITIIGLLTFSNMQENFKDRYLSIVSSNTKNARTAEGRINGLVKDFKVGMHRPIMGHGLGTSREAMSNYGNENQPSHCIYTETFQEIGIVGLIVFLMFMSSIIKSLWLNTKSITVNFTTKLCKVCFILSLMNIFFGFASYGLSSYEWYFLGGLSVIINKSLRILNNEQKSPFDSEMASWRDQDLHTLCL